MQKKHLLTSMSFKACVKSSPRADGTNTIILRVLVKRLKKEFNLHVSWPANFFNHQEGVALPRNKKDKAHEMVNLVINQAKSKAHQIQMSYFAKEKDIDLEIFAKEFEEYEHRDNFLFYMRNKIKQLYHSKIIEVATYKKHRRTVEGLQIFYGNPFLPMNAINLDMVERFDVWLRKGQKYAHNTCSSYLKDFKTYVNHAIKDGYHIESPFEFFKFKFQPGFREALNIEELKKLKALMLSENLPKTERLVLRKFLFSCYTGLRISDSAKITSGMILNNVLTVKMQKGLRFGKVVEIFLPEYAQSLVEGIRGELFEDIADQTCNDTLKILAAKAGIEKRLTFHCSRDTFGTLFIELGGDPVTLKEIMGHTNIATTMIYVKMSEKRKEKLMSNFNTL